jgi:hypothetical protein
MSRMRAPRLAGVAGGVGTTTLATALRGYDRGRADEMGTDILVCRSTGESLHAAATAVTWMVNAGTPRPVLAVVADQPVPVRGPLRARLRMIEPQVAGLILVPYVGHWRDLTDPLAEAAKLSDYPADQLPRSLRGYGEALAALAGAVLHTGLLDHRPGGPHTPPPANRATGPIARAVPAADRAATTGDQPAVTGPHRALTGPQRAVTGSRWAVTATGPHRTVTTTGADELLAVLGGAA